MNIIVSSDRTIY